MSIDAILRGMRISFLLLKCMVGMMLSSAISMAAPRVNPLVRPASVQYPWISCSYGSPWEEPRIDRGI